MSLIGPRGCRLESPSVARTITAGSVGVFGEAWLAVEAWLVERWELQALLNPSDGGAQLSLAGR